MSIPAVYHRTKTQPGEEGTRAAHNSRSRYSQVVFELLRQCDHGGELNTKDNQNAAVARFWGYLSNQAPDCHIIKQNKPLTIHMIEQYSGNYGNAFIK